MQAARQQPARILARWYQGVGATKPQTSNACRQRGDDLRAFLRASARGFAWAAQRPELAAGLLMQHSGPCGTALDDLEMVLESQYEMSQVWFPMPRNPDAVTLPGRSVGEPVQYEGGADTHACLARP